MPKVEVTPSYNGICYCKNYLQPLTSWRDVKKRSEYSYYLRRTLVALTLDTREIGYIELHRCSDCGRYWAEQNCGSEYMTRSMPFFYFIGIEMPTSCPDVLGALDENDYEYKTLIAPHLKL
jgi:hypothetical protein